jgi:GLPGLI family protein
MKKIRTYGLFMLALLAVIQVNAQKKITEGTISYDIIINTGKADPQIADMFDGATSIVYIKGPQTRSEMISSLGTQSTIIDATTGNVTVLKEYGDQKYMIPMTPANWKEANQKYDGVTFTMVDDFKTIAGYKSQKAIGKLKDGTSFSVYFTRDLVPVNTDFQYANKGLPGLVMEYESVLGNLRVTYTVSGISFNPVSTTKFELPKSGFRIVTYNESKRTGG